MKTGPTDREIYINGRIAANIERLRRLKGLTYHAIAKRIDMTDATVFRYCRENNPPKVMSVAQLIRIAAAMGVPLTSLIGLDNSELLDPDAPASKALEMMALLSTAGQEHAMLYIADLTKVPEYRKDESVISSPGWSGAGNPSGQH